jgi:myo-inositol-1(or 4)-monophosphatase
LNLRNLKQLAIKAAKEAGEYLLKNKTAKKEIFSEQGRDIKLEIDRSTEKLIRTSLRESDISILGEEYGGKSSDGLVWVIDPIDGTANYFRGLDQCCISIALMDGNQALLGIIYNFNTNELFHAQHEQGAFLNDLPISVSNISEKNKASLTTGFPASESIESSLDFLDGLKEWKKIRMFGSAALSCAYISSGRCDAYIEKGVYLWDFAAGICLVNEAGGRVQFSKIDSERYSVKFDNNCL